MLNFWYLNRYWSFASICDLVIVFFGAFGVCSHSNSGPIGPIVYIFVDRIIITMGTDLRTTDTNINMYVFGCAGVSVGGGEIT